MSFFCIFHGIVVSQVKVKVSYKKMKCFVLGLWLSSRPLAHYALGPGFNHKHTQMKKTVL
jgi:hypothetical protein